MDRTLHDSDELSPAAIEALLHLLVHSEHRRVSSAAIDGRTVWIKRYGVGAGSLAKGLHRLLSPLVPVSFLRSSPGVTGPGHVARELRKAAAFRAAGFPSVSILYSRDDLLVMSDAGTIVQEELTRLRGPEPRRHDDLLVASTEALGQIHAAGLCHGRPHPRDMILKGRRFGFLDFEEEPEAAMPLAAAQARDAWLMFLQVSGQSLHPATPGRAFAAYRRLVPPPVLHRLRAVVKGFSLLNPLLRLAGPMLGRDGQRMLAGTTFLKSALSANGASLSNRPAVPGELRNPSHD